MHEANKTTALAATPSPPEQILNLASPMNHAKNQYIRAFDAIDNDVLAHNEAAQAHAKIIVAGTFGIWEAGEKNETVGYRVNKPRGDIHAAAFGGYVKPHVIKNRPQLLRLRGEPSTSVRQLRNKPRAAAFFHFSRKLPHRFLCDRAALAASKGSAGAIERSQEIHAPTLAVFPQPKRLPHRLLLAL
jgi:hypothetical protein